MEFLFHAHSGLRYLVLLAGAIAAVHALIGWIRGRRFGRTPRLLGRIFTGLLDLQIVLGLILLFDRFYPQLIGHITMMVLAAAAVHGTAVVQKRRPAEQKSHALQFAGITLALLLIAGGILAIGRSVV